jgi:hypothetical protein
MMIRLQQRASRSLSVAVCSMQAELVRLVCHWGAARPLADTAAAVGAELQCHPYVDGGHKC